MESLATIVNNIWRKGNNMPVAKPRPESTPFSLDGDILSRLLRATDMVARKKNVAIYGRNRIGKTTFACQGGVPTLLFSIEPSPMGGAESVTMMPNVVVCQVALRHLTDKDGNPDPWRGSDKIAAYVNVLHERYARGNCPFKKVVVDGVTSWNDVILGEILGIDYEKMPAVLDLGKVSSDQYIERGERMIRYLKPILDLPCDVWILAQEKDHNAPKTETTTRQGKKYTRPTQSPLMREAHPMSQEGSWFSLAVSDTQAKFIQDACPWVMQMYEDAETVEVTVPDVVVNGETIRQPPQRVPTGRQVKRLRCVYHPNYAAGFRAPDWRAVPEYIEAPTPEERYQAFLDVASGKKTKWGYYPENLPL